VAPPRAHLKLLPSCKVDDSSYGFLGTGPRELVVRMKPNGDVEATPPLVALAPFAAANLRLRVEQGESLELKLVTIGQRSAAPDRVGARDLVGSCAGATHFQLAKAGAASPLAACRAPIHLDLTRIGP
jgi:hypothetical protein